MSEERNGLITQQRAHAEKWQNVLLLALRSREAADALFGGVSSGIFETNNLPQLAKFASLAALAKPNSLSAEEQSAGGRRASNRSLCALSLSDT